MLNALAYYKANVNVALVPRSNYTIASYNSSAVKIYNATSSLVRIENKKNSTFINGLVYYSVVNVEAEH
jgi:hypothetical protein